MCGCRSAPACPGLPDVSTPSSPSAALPRALTRRIDPPDVKSCRELARHPTGGSSESVSEGELQGAVTGSYRKEAGSGEKGEGNAASRHRVLGLGTVWSIHTAVEKNYHHSSMVGRNVREILG